MGRQLLIMVAAFALGTGIAELLGAANLGVALGVGAIAFTVATVWLILADGPRLPGSKPSR